MFQGQNKYIFGRFGGHLDTKKASAQSGGLRMFIVSTRVPTEARITFLTFRSTVFEVEVEVDDDVG
jgi:hypothetical protein